MDKKTYKLVPEGIGEILYDQEVDGKQTNVAIKIYDVVNDELVTYVYRGVWEAALACADYGPKFIEENQNALSARKFTAGLKSQWPEDDPEFILKAMGVKDLALAVDAKVSPKNAEEWWRPVLDTLASGATSVAQAAVAIIILRLQLAMGGASEFFLDEAARQTEEELLRSGLSASEAASTEAEEK